MHVEREDEGGRIVIIIVSSSSSAAQRTVDGAAPVYGDAVEALLLAAKDAADSLEAAAKIVRPQFPGSAHLMDERREALQAALAAVRKPAGVR